MLLWIFIFIIVITVLLYRYEIFGEGEKGHYSGEPWFTLIKEGKKKIDVKLGPEEIFSKYIGGKMKIKGKKEVIEKEVVDVKHYDNIKELMANENHKLIAPHLSDKDCKEEMFNYFTEEKTAKSGINAIHFK